jgi:undecaprenyl-diphosphatase
MSVWEAIVLGLVQGLTEFLPVSSSAHLRIVGELIGSGDPGAAFTAIVLLGLLFQDAIEAPFRNLWLIVLTLTVFALVLDWADRRSSSDRELTDLTPRHAVYFGLAQAMALVPGVSRSGGTITAGRLMGYSRTAAARYSFLLAIPAVLGSGFYQLGKSAGSFGEAGVPGIGVTLIATVIAFVVGYVVIIGFLKIVSTYSYRPFVVYRIGLAVVVALLLLTGVLDPLAGA